MTGISYLGWLLWGMTMYVVTSGAGLVIVSEAPVAPSQVDVFQTTSQIYTLSKLPDANADVTVIVNGLVMTEGIDYTLVGKVLTFTLQNIGPNSIIQVRYKVKQ